jgi:hypothetical protein
MSTFVISLYISQGCLLKLLGKIYKNTPPPQAKDITAKVGIRNFSPHLHNSAILRTTKSIAELRTKKRCGSAIADLQNMTSAIPQLSAVSSQLSYFILPFPQLRML